MKREGYDCDAHGAKCPDEVRHYIATMCLISGQQATKYDDDGEVPTVPESEFDALVDSFRFDACEVGASQVLGDMKNNATRRRNRPQPSTEGTNDAGAEAEAGG